MTVSYKKLWKLLIDKDMRKIDLERGAKLSHYTMFKLRKNENVSTEVICKICDVLNCTVDDVMELISDK